MTKYVSSRFFMEPRGKVKFLAVLAVSFLFLSFGFLFIKNNKSKTNKQVEKSTNLNIKSPNSLNQDLNQNSAFARMTKTLYAPPKKIVFGDKVLDIEEVGVLEDGTLDVPKDWNRAGWYAQGAKPGEVGNVIIDGHYDTNTGKPAAFWGLKDLKLNDKVLIVDTLGRIFVYKVEEKFYISINDPNRAQVFNSSQDKILTLITCGGVWDNISGTYNKRLVIKAKFESMERGW